jgi:hypothetical protein
VSRSAQLRGWHWNREVHSLSPDINGNINLPNNVAKVDTTGIDYPVDVVQRGLRLFNIDDNTYVFTRPIKLQLYVILDFTDLNATVKSISWLRPPCSCSSVSLAPWRLTRHSRRRLRRRSRNWSETK